MNIENKKRLFVDLDGTLAVFKPVDTLEVLYEKKYFLNLQPQQTVVDAIKYIMKKHPEIEVNILSAVLSDSKYALEEKNNWIDRYLPEITSEHRLFPLCGESKRDFIDGGISASDFLLDDYTVNLNEWEPPARGIKLMNGINGTKGTWKSEKISVERSGIDMAEKIINIMNGEEHLMDKGPMKTEKLYMGENIQYDADTLKWLLSRDESYRYMMLSRMQQDCEYYLKNGGRNGSQLWGEAEDAHIFYMKNLYESFSDDKKPEWITPEDIYKYQYDMCSRWHVDSADITHDGYVNADISIVEYKNGHVTENRIAAKFCVSDSSSEKAMQLISLEPGVERHPFLVNRWNDLEKDVKTRVLQEEILNAYKVIVYRAKTDTLNQQSPWGSWFGRIVDSEHPQHYMDVDVTGVERTMEYIVDLKCVYGNWTESVFQFKRNISLDTSIDGIVEDIIKDGTAYLFSQLDSFDMDHDKGFQLYSPYTECALDQHYQMLEEKGYEKFPVSATNKTENIQENQQKNKSNVVNFNHVRRGR